jgi:hypothetical protein
VHLDRVIAGEIVSAGCALMVAATATTWTRVHATPERRLPRKVRLDSYLHRPHSLRASDGDVNCDHDFEVVPSVTGADFAVWECTKCSPPSGMRPGKEHQRQPDVAPFSMELL